MKTCPNCGCKPEDDFEPTTADEYNRGINFTNFMDSVIKRSSDRMKKELGYGIPDNKRTKEAICQQVKKQKKQKITT